MDRTHHTIMKTSQLALAWTILTQQDYVKLRAIVRFRMNYLTITQIFLNKFYRLESCTLAFLDDHLFV